MLIGIYLLVGIFFKENLIEKDKKYYRKDNRADPPEY